MATRSRHIRGWLVVSVLWLAAICMLYATLLVAFWLWLPHANLPSDFIVQACVGRVASISWWGVWWTAPGIAAMPPPSIASRQAICGYVPRPPSWAQQGSFSLSP